MNDHYPLAHRLTIEWNKQLADSAFLHKYGGIPSNGIVLPRCSGCHEQYHLLFQIDLRDQSLNYLEITNTEFLFVISCLNCATYEKPIYYTLKNHKKIVVIKASPGKYVHEYPSPLEEHQVSCRKLLKNEYPHSNDGFYYDLPAKRGNHQLGGKPLWVQDEEHIKCVKCKRGMSYLAMIDTELHIGQNGFREKGHMFGDNGILYMFVCRRCGIFSAKAQGL
ncbi:MAG: hypothetical protein JW836_11550 [Deltaproteobacteria bacterium]|nr:hypothetical protein [Deltaproteobacteria bacterium]